MNNIKKICFDKNIIFLFFRFVKIKPILLVKALIKFKIQT